MKILYLTKSENDKKKYKAIIYVVDGKKKKIRTFHFGAAGYQDFTQHKDENRRKNYIRRHSKRESWGEINPGSLSRYLLWNKPTLSSSIKDFEKRFNIKIIRK